MAHPSWLCYSHYGWDKELDWEEVKAVASDLPVPFFNWFADIQGEAGVGALRSTMSEEILFGFESAQAERLNSIVQSLGDPLDDTDGSASHSRC